MTPKISFLRHICLAFLFFLHLVSSARAVDYYVSPTGADTNTGTSLSSPWLNIVKAVQATHPGDTVYLRGGTYFQRADVRWGGGSALVPVVVRPYGSEQVTISGADIVTGWVSAGVASDGKSIYKKTGWTVDSQQVFVGSSASTVILNGTPLQQIGVPSGIPASNVAEAYPVPTGSGIGDLQGGRFYYDKTAQTLYICLSDGADPNTRGIAASTRRRTLFFDPNVQYITVQNINFRYSNVTAETNASPSVCLSAHSKLLNCNIQWADSAGVGLADYATVENCIVSNNGLLGVGASLVIETLVRGCTIQNNNYRHFNPSWGGGGMKSTSSAYGIIEYNEISNNFGQGIWYDYCLNTHETIARNNYIHDNKGTYGTLYVTAGIMVEVSENAKIYNNVLRDNSKMGIYVSASNGTKIYNNTVTSNGSPTHGAIQLGGMPRINDNTHVNATLKNNTITNNIFYNNTSDYDLVMYGDVAPDISGNSADYNLYYRSGGGFISNKVTPPSQQAYYNITNWRTGTGWDLHGLQANPNFFSGTGSSFGIPTTSPAKGVGDPSVNLLFDFTGAPRSATSNDIGAFQAAPTITNGTYLLQPTCAPITRLDAAGMNGIGTNLQIWGLNNQANQKWVFTNLGNGYFKIQPSYNLALAVEVNGGQDANGINTRLNTDNSSSAQQWRLTAYTDGTYSLSPRCASSRSLEVSGSASTNGTLCVINLTHGSASQRWTFSTPV